MLLVRLPPHLISIHLKPIYFELRSWLPAILGRLPCRLILLLLLV